MEVGIMSRVTEAEVAEAVENILHDGATGHASIQELIREIPNRITLSADDLKSSPTRHNEAIWEQQVRNITSHKDSPGNAIFEGRLVAISGGLALPTKSSAL
jgi:glycine cleavage system pyridoxal-binding protein P